MPSTIHKVEMYEIGYWTDPFQITTNVPYGLSSGLSWFGTSERSLWRRHSRRRAWTLAYSRMAWSVTSGGLPVATRCVCESQELPNRQGYKTFLGSSESRILPEASISLDSSWVFCSFDKRELQFFDTPRHVDMEWCLLWPPIGWWGWWRWLLGFTAGLRFDHLNRLAFYPVHLP